MFKKTAIIAGIGLALSATAQADYNWQLDAGVARGSVDTEIKNTPNSNQKNSEDSTIGGLGATYFLETVDTSKGPLNEAAFLDHASSVGIRWTTAELDLASVTVEIVNTVRLDSVVSVLLPRPECDFRFRGGDGIRRSVSSIRLEAVSHLL